MNLAPSRRTGVRSTRIAARLALCVAALAVAPHAGAAASKALPFAIGFEGATATQCADALAVFGRDAPPEPVIRGTPLIAQPSSTPTPVARFSGRCAMRADPGTSGRDGSPDDAQRVALRLYAYMGFISTASFDLVRFYDAAGTVVGRIFYVGANNAFRLDDDADDGDSTLLLLGVARNRWHLVELVFDNNVNVQRLEARLFAPDVVEPPNRTTRAIGNAAARVDFVEIGWIEGIGGIINGTPPAAGLILDAYAIDAELPAPLNIFDASGNGVLDVGDYAALREEVASGTLAPGQPDCDLNGLIDNNDLDCFETSAPPTFDSLPAPSSTITINDVVDGAPSSVQLFLRNVGGGTIDVGPGTGLSAPLSISGPSGATLRTFDGTNAASYAIECNASALGPVTQTLAFNSVIGAPLASYTVVCNGQSPPQFTSNPPPGPIAIVDGVDGSATTVTVVVSNTAGAGAGDLVLTAESAANPRITISPLGLQRVAPGSSVEYTVACNAIAAGATESTLVLTHNGSGSPAQFPITCTGVAALASEPAPGTPIVLVDPIDGAASTTTLVVRNASTGPTPPPLALQAPSGLSAPLSVTPATPQNLAGSASVTYTIGCNAVSTQTVDQTLLLANDGVPRPASYPVRCIGAAPVLEATPAPGSTIVLDGEEPAAPRQATITVRNTTSGRGPGYELVLSGCSVSNAARFAVAPTGFTVLPGASNTLTVTCTVPTNAGERQSGVLSCNSNDPRRPVLRYGLACANRNRNGGGIAREEPLEPPPDAGADDAAGTGVSLGGDVAVVTAPGAGSRGRIYLYLQNASGGFGSAGGGAPGKQVEGPRLGKIAPSVWFDNPLPPPPMGGDKWGAAVAVSGNGSTIAVGAPGGGADGAGRVVVFQEPPAGWGTGAPTVTVLGPSSGGGLVPSDFGTAVAFDAASGAIVVGAPGTDVGGAVDAGATFAFVPSAGSYSATPSATATPPAPASGNKWGSAVDASDGVVLIGAPGSGTQLGQAFVANLTPGGFAGTTAVPPPGGGQGGDKWGAAVTIAGGTIAIGAPGRDTALGTDSGAVGVFTLGAGLSLSPGATLLPTAFGGNVQGMGFALDTNGTAIVVGAPTADPNAVTDQGVVYVFGQPEAGWTGTLLPDASIVQAGGAAGDLFGSAVSIFGTFFAAGAPGDDVDDGLGNTFIDQGSADVFALDRILRDGFQ